MVVLREEVFMPSMKSARLNIFGMINRDNVIPWIH